MIAHSSNPSPTIESNAPAGSGLPAAGFLDSGTSRHAASATMISNGTLTKNTEPHHNLDNSRPPASGPIAIPTPIVPPHTPIAPAPSRGFGKTSWRIDKPAGVGIEAPRPRAPPPPPRARCAPGGSSKALAANRRGGGMVHGLSTPPPRPPRDQHAH